MVKITDTAANIMKYCYQNMDTQFRATLDYNVFNQEYPTNEDDYKKAMYYLTRSEYITDNTLHEDRKKSPDIRNVLLSIRAIDVVDGLSLG